MVRIMARALNDEECWTAVQQRDGSYDGRFFYGVRTTGIFCRPSCRSRLAKRENVSFYPSVDAAQRSGLRACLRCRPLEHGQADARVGAMADLARLIDSRVNEPLPLAELADAAGLSPSHLQRTFRRVMGVSPKQYQTARRFERLKASLRADAPVLDAVFDAGFGSSSRVYERIDDRLGMTPSAYRDGGGGEIIAYAARDTALGWLLLAATARGVCFVEFGDSEDGLLERLREEFTAAELVPSPALDDRELDEWIFALERCLAGDGPSPSLPLELRGTAFQMRVWRFLLGVREGTTVSYGQVASAIGAASSARAVANACAANRVAVLVPCHRVLRGDGALGGYRWGEERKRELLEKERDRSGTS